jgi:hypothetical protein
LLIYRETKTKRLRPGQDIFSEHLDMGVREYGPITGRWPHCPRNSAITFWALFVAKVYEFSTSGSPGAHWYWRCKLANWHSARSQ